MVLSRRLAGLLPVLVLLLPSCFDTVKSTANLEINLYSGIRGVANLGDSWSQVQQVCKWRTVSLELPSGSDENRIQFSEAHSIPDLGTRLYFRDGRIALIEIQEPFKGSIQGKTLKLFDFKPPPDKSWDDVLQLQFGPPLARASGGRFGSEANFYSWGDISYNRMGTNELAIYRDATISNFRQKHFGRDISGVFQK
jgi:hypothetical protein